MKKQMIWAGILAVLISGCSGTYVAPDGTVYTGVTDDAAYNMAVRDASTENAKTYATSMKEMKDNPGGQVGVSMAAAINKPAFKAPESWIDKAIKLYPLVRDAVFLGYGFNGDRRNSSEVETTLSDVKVGRDLYINSERADQVLLSGSSMGDQSGGSFPKDSGNVFTETPTDNSVKTDNSTTDNSVTDTP